MAQDAAQYSQLLEGLVLQARLYRLVCASLTGWVFKIWLPLFAFQGFYQLLEPKVTVRCRQQDVDLVQVRLIKTINASQQPVGHTGSYWSTGCHR